MSARRRRSLWLCIIVVALWSGPFAAAQSRPFLFACGRYTAMWAGRPWSYDQQCWDHMVNIGVTMTGCGLCWCDAEPEPGVYDWDQIGYADFAVDEILARGMEPTFFLGLTPQWAALRPDLPPHRTPPAEEYVDEFMDFHRFVADRYRGRVRYYFFWNEPNGCSWINDGCANSDSYPLYTQWLIRCSQAVKQMDPDAKIIGGNLDYHSGVPNGWQYVEGMYQCGAGPYIDGIAIHPYDWSGTIHWQAIIDTRNVMVAWGDADKGIWLTEYGWNTGSEQERADKLTQTLTELKKDQWSYVVQACYLVLNDGSGVENYGLMDADLNPRAAYYAFRDFDKTFPPAVDFSADVRIGPGPLVVHFTDDSSVTDPTGWLWQFGDGQISHDQNPTHTYTQEGTYTVRLTVTSAAGEDSAQKDHYIRVGSFPRVAFIGGQIPLHNSDQQTVEHLESLGLIIDAYDDDRENRPPAETIAAEHDLLIGSTNMYSGNVAGDFRHLAIPFVHWEPALNQIDREPLADAWASTGYDQTQIEVLDNGHPITAGLSLGAVTVIAGDPTMLGVAQGNIGSGVQVLATCVGQSTNRTILAAEAGAMLLDGEPAAARTAFLFLHNDTDADFAADVVAGTAPLTVQFTDQSNGAITLWAWDFGDGTTSELRHPSHTYTKPGIYDVSLTVTSVRPTDTELKVGLITVLPAPGDFDEDGDVDLDDYETWLVPCYTGPGGQASQGCEACDLDGDADVDLIDFASFQAVFTGN